MDLDEMARHWGMRIVRQLPDGSLVGLGDLMTTRAIYFGLNHWGWERRFCFADLARADAEFDKLQTEDDQPTGWFARRPEQPCDIAAKTMPGYLGGDPALASNWAQTPGLKGQPLEGAAAGTCVR